MCSAAFVRWVTWREESGDEASTAILKVNERTMGTRKREEFALTMCIKRVLRQAFFQNRKDPAHSI